jgi:hypothetical protein
MFLSVMGVAAFLVVANQALAVEPLKLTWTSLAPKTGAVDKLFEGLTEQQLNDLARLYQARRMANNGDKSMLEDLKPLSRKFLKQGVDVESLFARLEQVTREADRAVVPALSGKRVALSGYLLPLEYSEKKTTEFLLVPYVGACIHAPTPPANQIVHVKYNVGSFHLLVSQLYRRHTHGRLRLCARCGGSRSFQKVELGAASAGLTNRNSAEAVGGFRPIPIRRISSQPMKGASQATTSPQAPCTIRRVAQACPQNHPITAPAPSSRPPCPRRHAPTGWSPRPVCAHGSGKTLP